MKKLLMIGLLSATCAHAAVFPNPEETDPNPVEAVQSPLEHAIFLERLEYFKTDDDWAGIKIGVRVGIEWAIVDRSMEAKKVPNAPSQSTLDKVLAAVVKSGAASANASIIYTETGFDENGKPWSKTLQINAGGASGAAAMAAADMANAMSKNHK